MPGRGRANKAVIKLLANHPGLPRAAIAIASGHTARLKILTLSGDPATLATALNALA